MPAVLALLVVFATPGVASAHAELLLTKPLNNQVLAESPTSVELQFGETVGTTSDSVRLLKDTGQEIALGAIHTVNGGKTVTASVSGLKPGVYVVTWHVVSADSHPVRGAYLFTVGTATSTDQGSQLEVSALKTIGAPSQTKAAWATARFFTLLFSCFVIGFLILVALEWEPIKTKSVTRTTRTIALLGIPTALILLITDLKVDRGQKLFTGVLKADFNTLSGTRFGFSVWLRIGALLLAVLFTYLKLPRVLSRFIALAIGTVVAASLVVGGHASTGRWLPIAVPVDILHSMAAGMWLTGLVMLVFLGSASSQADVQRFSRYALRAVIVIIVTGLFASLRQAGSINGFLHTTYGHWLEWKLIAFGLIIAVAYKSKELTHRDEFNPKLIIKFVTAELLLMIFVFAATGILSAQVPARDALALPISSTISAKGLDFDFTIDPTRAGPTTIHFYTLNPNGQTRDIEQLTVEITNKKQNVGPISINMIQVTPNHYVSNDASFPFPGKWQLTARARISAFDEIAASKVITIH